LIPGHCCPWMLLGSVSIYLEPVNLNGTCYVND
jgi:hypothetical protein